MTKGAAEKGALCAFCLLPEVAGTYLTNLLYIWVTTLPLIYPALSGAPSSCIGPEWIWCLMEKRQNDSTLKWFTGMRHLPLCAALVIELMSKQFITHLRGSFLEAYKGILYVCMNTAQWVKSGGRLWGHVRSRKAVFVSGPSRLDRYWQPIRSLSYEAYSSSHLNVFFVSPLCFHHKPLVTYSTPCPPATLPSSFLFLPSIRETPPWDLTTALSQWGFSH